jgi:hypothetical protein
MRQGMRQSRPLRPALRPPLAGLPLRALTCMHGAAEGSEGLWCRRSSTGDGWIDTLQYTISMRPLGADRSRVRGEIDTARIAHLRIESIDWQPAPAAP